MKSNYGWLGLGIIIGAVVVAIVFWLWPCNQMKTKGGTGYVPQSVCSDTLPGVRMISVDTANKYFRCYWLTPILLDTFKGFRVSVKQLNAMNLLYNSDTSLVGFRIYMGIYGDPEDVSEIVGVASDGSDDTTTIYTAPKDNSGPCPPVCDESSPIPDHD